MDERQIAMKMGGQDEQLSRSSSPQKANSLDDLLASCPRNETIRDSMIKCWVTINNPKYKKIVCSISGGSDSDIMLDIVWKCDVDDKVDYVWLDTGLEYQATKDHLKYLEGIYGIEVASFKGTKSIPTCCREYGQPFVSKQASKMIYGLQLHGFQWKDRPFEELIKEYPRCKNYLQWWCNERSRDKVSMYDICVNKWLKEFMILNPPKFKISDKCCYYAKKKLIHSLIKENGYDLHCTGIRRSEGGLRSTAYKSCLDEREDCDNYRPLFWYTNSDKKDYEEYNGITHSECYTKYGMIRTGCCGCPFGYRLENDLKAIQEYEPKLYKAICNIFGESYEYTKKYREFCKMKNEEVKLSKLR